MDTKVIEKKYFNYVLASLVFWNLMMAGLIILNLRFVMPIKPVFGFALGILTAAGAAGYGINLFLFLKIGNMIGKDPYLKEAFNDEYQKMISMKSAAWGFYFAVAYGALIIFIGTILSTFSITVPMELSGLVLLFITINTSLVYSLVHLK